jgi:putative membrane protein
MLTSSIVAYLHFVFAFGIVATLFFEWMTFSRAPTLQEARRLAAADRWYGLFAMGLLVVGGLRAASFGKGWEFYAHNGFFHLKLTLFVVIGLLSIYPTVRFIRWRPELKAGRAPQVSEAQYRIVARCLGAQMLLLAVLLASASLMAHGVGSRG